MLQAPSHCFVRQVTLPRIDPKVLNEFPMPPHRTAEFRPGPEISLSKVNFSLWKASTMGTPPRTRLTNRASYPIYDAWRGRAGFSHHQSRIPFGGWSRPLGEG